MPYNFLKYRHKWKKCLYCGAKVKRIKNGMYKCQRDKKELVCQLEWSKRTLTMVVKR